MNHEDTKNTKRESNDLVQFPRNYLKAYCCSLFSTARSQWRKLWWYLWDGLGEIVSGVFRIATWPLMVAWFCLLPVVQVIAIIRHRNKISWKKISWHHWWGGYRGNPDK